MDIRRLPCNTGVSTIAFQIYCIEVYTPKSLFCKFMCFAGHIIDPAELVNPTKARFDVNKASLDKPEN